MRIGYDVSSLCVPRSGVGTYTLNLWQHLLHEPADSVVPLAQRSLDMESFALDGAGIAEPLLSPAVPLNKTLWMQLVLPRLLMREQMDVCHFTNNIAPLWSPMPLVLTIHDMTLWLYPSLHYRRRLLAMRPLIPLAARHAAAVITVSESAKRDIVRILGLPAEKVHVVHEAPADCFQPMQPHVARAALAGRYTLPERFVLHVGTLEPRKNLVRLLQAFARLRVGNARPAIPHHLVFVGPRGWKNQAVFAAVEQLGLAGAVHFLDYVPTADLVALYNLADALAFPSLYEGFGLPVVEAMATGTPVVTSRNGSLGEIAGDAAQFVEPTSVESIADGLERVLCDAGRRAALRDMGWRVAARYTWAATARQTRAVYALATGAPAWPRLTVSAG